MYLVDSDLLVKGHLVPSVVLKDIFKKQSVLSKY